MASDSEDAIAKSKRKADTLEENEEPTKKKKLYDLNFSEIEFKVKLRDDETITSGLEDFVNLADAHSDGVECIDIVSRYCTSSPDCTELLGLLDITQKKLTVGQVSLVYECLTHILKYIQSNANTFRSTGDTIVQRILSAHLGQMYNYLRDQNKSKTIKRALQLLISMVMLNDKTKKAVQSRFNFDHEMFQTLFHRRDRQDPEDVRSCLVLFTMSFIVEGDGELINAMVQQKGFIQMTVTGLMHDPKDMVLDVLATILDKVVKNPDVSKTAKIKLFSEKILKQMCDLYDWEGPRGWRPKKDKRQSDAQKAFLNDEDFQDERAIVVEMVHEYLLAMCSSQKHGIIFYDKTIGTGSKNLNQLLTHLLQSLALGLEHPLKRNLAVHILRACPDQLFHFLSSWGQSLTTRWSEKLATNMNFLVEVYENLPTVPTFLSNLDGVMKDVDSLVSLMVTYYLPSPKIALNLTLGVRSDDLRIRHHCLLVMQAMVQKSNMILSTISSHQLIHAGAMRETLCSVFTSLVTKTLPSSTTLFVCVEKVLEILSSPKKLESIGVEIDLLDHVATILKTLKLYQSLCPNLLSERPKDVAKLVEAVGKLQLILDESDEVMKDVNENTDSKVALPQLDLLKLLSETDAKTLSLGREGLLEKLLRSAYQCLKEKHKEETISHVCKMLTSLDVLSGHDKELHLWIDIALTYEAGSEKDAGSEQTVDSTSSASLICFLSTCLCTLINNPMPYLDRVMEVVADASSSAPDVSDDEDTNVSVSDRLTDSEIQDIVKIKDEDLDLSISDDLLEKSRHQTNALPFSPLSLIALEKLQYSKGDTVGKAEYVSAVLVKIIHTQMNPVPYGVLVNCSKASLSEGVREYFQYWGGSKKKLTKTTPQVNLKFSIPFSCFLLNWYVSGEDSQRHTDTKDIQDIPHEEKLLCMNQAIFYLEHCYSPNFGLGQKVKKVKILRKAIEDIFSSYVEELNTPENPSPDNDEDDVNKDVEMKEDKPHLSSDGGANVVDKLSEALICIVDNPTLKSLFLSPSQNVSTPSKAEKSKKVEHSISKLLCNIFVTCKDLDLSTSCGEVLKGYLDKALNHVLREGDDLESCLVAVETIACHVDLPVLNKCTSTFLKVLKTSFVGEVLSEKELIKVHKGQLLRSLPPIAVTFLQILDLWIKNIKLYTVVEMKGSSVLLALPSESTTGLPDKSDSSTIHSSHQVPLQSESADTKGIRLDVSDLESLFDFLVVCSNFDSPICNLVEHFPQLSLWCSQEVSKSLIAHYLSVGKDRRILMERMVSSHDVFHKLGGSYLRKNIDDVIKNGHFSLLRAYLGKQTGDTKIIQTIRKKMLASCKEILPINDENLWAALDALVRPVAGSDDDFCKDLFSAVKSFISKNSSLANVHHFSLLSIINKHWPASLKRKPEGSDKAVDGEFLEIIMKHFMFVLSKRSNRNIELEEKLLHFAAECVKCGNVLSSDFTPPAWTGFVRSSLKHLYSKATLLDLLSNLSVQVYAPYNDSNDKENGGQGKPGSEWAGTSPQVMFEMCVSHTAFLPTLLSTTDVVTKEALVNLLFTLFTIEPSCMKKELVSPFIGAYSARLSLTDQRLLKMMQVFLLDSETSNTFPVLWGKAYLDHKTNTKTLGPSLDTEIAMKKVLGEIDTGKLHKTILHFAFRRNTKDFDVCSADKLNSESDCYDPSYLLRVFLQILSPDKIVQVRSFVSKECLGFILISLTSYHLHCRLLAYQCLNEFYGHLENSGCPERHEFAFILDILNASRLQSGQKLSTVVALFLTRAIRLMNDPSDHMYLPVLRFLTLKPEMDLGSVPEFYNFFFSARSQYARERNWMLALLRDGIRDSSDYWLYQKRLIFRLLMSFYSSSISDKISQVLVLETVRNTCYQKAAAVDLINEHGLLPWLSCAISGLQERPEHTKLLCTIVSTLCTSLGATDHVEAINTEVVKRSPMLQSDITETAPDGQNLSSKENVSSTSKEEKMDVGKEEGKDETIESGIPKSILMSLNVLAKSLNWFLKHDSSITSKVTKHSSNDNSAEK